MSGIFKHVYVMCLKANEFGEITHGNGPYAVITPFKVIQGHPFWYNRKLIYDFLLVINTNLPPILHRVQVMADYSSNFR